MKKTHYNFKVCQKYHEARTIPLYETMKVVTAKTGEQFTLVGGFDQIDGVPILRLSDTDNYLSAITKTINCFLYHLAQNTQFNIFFLGDDDAYINFEEYLRFADTIDLNDLAVYGNVIGKGLINKKHFMVCASIFGEGFVEIAGGSGIMMNRRTFLAIARHMKEYGIRHCEHGDITIAMNIFDYNNKHGEKIEFRHVPQCIPEYGQFKEDCVTWHGKKDQAKFLRLLEQTRKQYGRKTNETPTGCILLRDRYGSRYKYSRMFERICPLTDRLDDSDFVIQFHDACDKHDKPYILIMNDVPSLRRDGIPTQREHDLVSSASGVLFASPIHLEYVQKHYGVENYELVLLRPLLEDLRFIPLPKQPKTVVYAGGIGINSNNSFGYRDYRQIFSNIIDCGWTVHIYPIKEKYEECHAYGRIGCVVHNTVPPNALYQHMSQYSMGFQGYSHLCDQRYTQVCYPNKAWEYLAAGIPTLGFNTGPCGNAYNNKWGLVAESMSDFHSLLPILENWTVPPHIRYSQTIDRDLPKFQNLIRLMT